jgi:hypothetical protein
MTIKKTSALAHNAAINERAQAVAAQVTEQQGWLEKKLKPKKITARYPFKGSPLLYATCAFGSLGDALFGYNSGTNHQHLAPHKDVADANVRRNHVRLAG